jgi:pyrimidine-nucleoside phosphorylase
MLLAPLIERKRDGGRLTPAEWSDIIAGYTAGGVPDYQMAALLMAVVFNGLGGDELHALTGAMLRSGAALDLAGLAMPRVDKHSTGGVGDKVSLILTPLVAACGAAVPMMAGRGLGHTGGTLDKLEAIPGFRTRLSLVEARDQITRIGCVVFGPTDEIAPADRRMYALRDATATVESIPLIAASILSKKLAESLHGLVLDVKHGAGALMADAEDALELAQTMIHLGRAHGCETVGLLTAMDRPLGHACGNALEVEEAFAVLRGEGPDDVTRVTLALAAEMLHLVGCAPDRVAARALATEALASGRAAGRCRDLIAAQGGNPGVLDDPAVLPQAPCQAVWTAPRDGVVEQVEPRRLGRAIIALGGGRRTMDDTVDPAVGFVITAKPGTRVTAGEPLATIHARDDDGVTLGRAELARAIVIVEELGEEPLPLITHRVTHAGVELF